MAFKIGVKGEKQHPVDNIVTEPNNRWGEFNYQIAVLGDRKTGKT
jgi:hypothetical protein